MSKLSAASFGAAVFFYVEEDGLVRLSGVRAGVEACEEEVDGVSWPPRLRRRR